MEGLRVSSNTVSFEISILKIGIQLGLVATLGEFWPQSLKVTRVILADLESVGTAGPDPSDLVFKFHFRALMRRL